MLGAWKSRPPGRSVWESGSVVRPTDSPLADRCYVDGFRFESAYPFDFSHEQGQQSGRWLTHLTDLRADVRHTSEWRVHHEYLMGLIGLHVGTVQPECLPTPSGSPQASPHPSPQASTRTTDSSSSSPSSHSDLSDASAPDTKQDESVADTDCTSHDDSSAPPTPLFVCEECNRQLALHRAACMQHGGGSRLQPFFVHKEPVFAFRQWITNDLGTELMARILEFGQLCLAELSDYGDRWRTRPDRADRLARSSAAGFRMLSRTVRRWTARLDAATVLAHLARTVLLPDCVRLPAVVLHECFDAETLTTEEAVHGLWALLLVARLYVCEQCAWGGSDDEDGVSEDPPSTDATDAVDRALLASVLPDVAERAAVLQGMVVLQDLRQWASSVTVMGQNLQWARWVDVLYRRSYAALANRYEQCDQWVNAWWCWKQCRRAGVCSAEYDRAYRRLRDSVGLLPTALPADEHMPDDVHRALHAEYERTRQRVDDVHHWCRPPAVWTVPCFALAQVPDDAADVVCKADPLSLL